MRTPDVRVFRPPRWVAVASVLAAAAFTAGAYWSYTTRGLSWLTYVYLGLVLLGVAGLLDSLTQRIELHAQHLVVVRNLSRREYPRSLFVKAQWAKGIPVSLQSVAGEWVRLPGVGGSGQGLVNTLRAWLRQ
jgi:hypothetical protein